MRLGYKKIFQFGQLIPELASIEPYFTNIVGSSIMPTLRRLILNAKK